MISPKKYYKTVKIPPNGFKSVNEFFNHVFKDKEMIWMGQNTNHLNDHHEIKEAMIEFIKSNEYCKYPPPEGFPELQELILKDLGLKNGFESLITAGGTESLYLCMHSYIEPGDRIITSDPGYLIIENFAKRFGAKVTSVHIYNKKCSYKLTPKLARDNIDEKTKIISLIDPLNPLGSSYTKDEIKEFAEISEEKDLYLLHDITYRDFAKKHHLAAKYAPERTLTIYSFSKICGMAGLRIGGVITAPEMMEPLKAAIINDLGTNALSQIGAIKALKTKKKWIKRVRERTYKNQKIIKKAVDEVEDAFIPVYPSNANMMAIDIYKTGVSPDDLTESLLKRKIFVRQGSYTSRFYGNRYIRLSFSIPKEQVKIFAENFTDLMGFLRN
ncbi:MAG TPA: pyridoxal phosphate-dependent aminotransferase [Methanothermobacter sp.]|jgi:aspartate/methionine/tyrosine aminotransferase|uniref:Aminotransferase n=1 Tax=Methanothermobacter tenebrarum TaxID=680118 RepID=A0ABM7YF24_9EURY|nr:pyridoxal phosphate-dependent aminotransferase [Methanothermobacter tenebrarum]MDI6882130.1 pyridoxal phosphate-dependent aminotransferase [Methanothermobacter sp.]MDX9692802.1 pyridoxal phosphate-dependent aminotransferase [Methanothermobacter sp.]BDH80054.1 aspartate aminotransferase [Methanothermobacter tenebrarum]HHW16392.1 pyridoxal phosphate-dependent aminotransferase [Methanothermobacter sp.]HOQ20207.1 pyridoxal phosphate-dependent aminotransferase [Methanothermobacter sp.]